MSQSVTLTDTQRFPEGTLVAAYLWPMYPLMPSTIAQLGAAVDTATMTGGLLTFDGLPDDTRFLAYAQVAGQDVFIRFSTDKVIEDGGEGPPGPEGPEGPAGPAGGSESLVPIAISVTNSFVNPRATAPGNFVALAPAGAVTQTPTSKVDGFQQNAAAKACQEVRGTPGGGYVALGTRIKAQGHPVAPLSASSPLIAARMAGKVVAAAGTWHVELVMVYFSAADAVVREVPIWTGSPAAGDWFVAEGFDSQAPATATYAELELRVVGSSGAVTLRGTEIVMAVDPPGDVPYYVGGDLSEAGTFDELGMTGAWLGTVDASASVGMFDPRAVYPAQDFGFNDYNAYAGSLRPGQAVELLRASGATMDRSLGTVLVKATSTGPHVTIADIEPTGLAYLHELVDAGFKVTINAGAAPWMAAAFNDGWPTTAPGRASFVEMILAVIADLGAENVLMVELGNEPNNPSFNINGLSAASYSAWVSSVTVAVHALYPTVKIAAAVLSMGGTDANVSSFAWLDGMYAANAQYDWLDIHPYPIATTVGTSVSSGPIVGGVSTYGLDLGLDVTMKQIRDYLAGKGDSARPLVVSEIGCLGAGNERIHGQVCALSVGRLRRDGQIKATMLHTLVDAVKPTGSTTVDAGAFDPTTLRARPAAHALAMMNAKRIAPTYGEVLHHDPSIDTAYSPGTFIANRGKSTQVLIGTVFASPAIALGQGATTALMFALPSGGLVMPTIEAPVAGSVGLIIKGAASQTANLTDWRNSSGTVIAAVGAGGSAFFGSVAATLGGNFGALTGLGALVSVTNTTASIPALIIKAATSQTANIVEWWDSTNTVIARVSALGLIQTPTIVATASAILGGGIGAGAVVSMVNNAATTTPTVITKNIAAQTADALQQQNSSGTVLAAITAGGNVIAANGLTTQVTIGTAFASPAIVFGSSADTFLLRTAASEIQTNRIVQVAANASHVPGVLRGFASQTGNLLEAQNSSLAVLAKITSAGAFRGVSDVVANDGLTTQVSLTTAFTVATISLGNAGDTLIFRTGAGALATQQITMQAAAGLTPVIGKGAVSQTADLFSAQNSSAAQLWGITAAGLPRYPVAGNAQTTVGAAGGASALPATPTKYFKVVDAAGTTLVIPAYAAA